MKIPKEVGRVYKPFDWCGWIMSILGLVLMAHFGGIFGNPAEWWYLLLTFLLFWEYAVRVAYGRVYRIVYYDTIIHPMYKLLVGGKQFFVNAASKDELALYMEMNYPNMDYEIVEDTHTETFIKTEKYL